MKEYFFLSVKTFAFPLEDKQSAQDKFEELILKYPKRKLTIVSIHDLEDILDRRKIVEIKNLSVLKDPSDSAKEIG